MSGTYRDIPLQQIIPNPGNHGERVLGDDEDQALVASVQINGVLQPINLRQIAPDKYMIVMGQRRWWAAREAGLAKIPAIVETIAAERVEDALLTENIARRNLSPYEQLTALLQAVRRHRSEAERRGEPRQAVEAIAACIGFSARQATRLWTISGRLTNDDHASIAALPLLRRSMTIVDLERIAATHVEDRASAIRLLAAAYEQAGNPAVARRRPPAASRGRVVLQDERHRRIAQCTMVADTRLKRVQVGLEVRLPTITNLADAETRRAVAADLRRTVEQLIAQIESHQSLDEDVVIVPTATYESLTQVGPGLQDDGEGGGDDEEPRVATTTGMIEDESDTPGPVRAAS